MKLVRIRLSTGTCISCCYCYHNHYHYQVPVVRKSEAFIPRILPSHSFNLWKDFITFYVAHVTVNIRTLSTRRVKLSGVRQNKNKDSLPGVN